jgi:folate-binding protein YgfZ
VRSLAEEWRAARSGVGLFELPGRGLLELRGADRVRWLDGMVTNDVKALAARGAGAGCRALLLTAQGRVVADLHLLLREDSLWLEAERADATAALARLPRYVVADDVVLVDRSAEFARLALEGGSAPALLEALLGRAPAPDAWAELPLADVPCILAAYALAGGPGFQVLAPAAARAAVRAELCARGAAFGLAPLGPETFECLRVEAGVPWPGRELDETVLPDEARLGAAVSTTKGCYTGQEVVARMRSRGRLAHRLVGLRLAGGVLPARGAELRAGGRRVGAVTSAVLSPAAGAIALAFVRLPHDAPGTRLEVEGGEATVAEVPFVAPPAAA